MNSHRAELNHVKRPTESRTFNINFKEKLYSGETISSIDNTTVTPSGELTATSPVASTTRVQYTVASGKAQVAFTGSGTTNVLSSTGHGLTNGHTVHVVADDADDLPTGLSDSEQYYVINAAADTFQLALITGGSAVALTTDGQGYVAVDYVIRCTATTSAPQTVIGEGVCWVRD